MMKDNPAKIPIFWNSVKYTEKPMAFLHDIGVRWPPKSLAGVPVALIW